MKELIYKSDLIAEIERLIDKGKYHEEYDCAYRDGNNSALYALKEIIDTLETKEVDLDKEFEWFLDEVEGVPRMWHPDEQIEWAKDIAKHFYELGLKTQKGEE